MSDSSKKHITGTAGKYLIKIFSYLAILLVITILTAFAVIKPVSNIVHKVEAYVPMENRDIVLNDDSYDPLSANSADGLKFNYGDKIANISSDDFGLNCSVYCGSNRVSLSEGAGFYGESALFGNDGTSIVKGYIEKYFSPLTYAEVNDTITVVTNYGEYNYRVTKVEYIDSEQKADEHTDGASLVLCGFTSDFSQHSGETLYVYAQLTGEVQ